VPGSHLLWTQNTAVRSGKEGATCPGAGGKELVLPKKNSAAQHMKLNTKH